MFADVATARQALDEYFNEPGVVLVLRLMQPVVLFEAVEGDAQAPLGASRIGGTPDLPREEPWPVRPVPADPEGIVARGGSRHGPHLRGHLAQPPPFGFLAQVDLAEAAPWARSRASYRMRAGCCSSMTAAWGLGMTGTKAAV